MWPLRMTDLHAVSPLFSDVMVAVSFHARQEECVQQQVAVSLSTVRLLLGAEAPPYNVNFYSHESYYFHCLRQFP